MRSLRLMGERIKALREEYGYTQDNLAKEVTRRFKSQGVKIIQSHVGNLESPSSVKLPSVQVLVALANVLEVTTDYLCGLTDDQSPPEPRFLTEEERKVEEVMKELSPSGQRRMALLAQSFLEEEKAPSTDALYNVIEAALDYIEALDESSVDGLLDKLEATSPAVAHRLTLKRQHATQER